MSNNRFYIAFEDTSNEQIYDAKLKTILWTHTENRITGASVDFDNGTWKPIGLSQEKIFVEKCEECNGQKYISTADDNYPRAFEICPECGGYGYYPIDGYPQLSQEIVREVFGNAIALIKAWHNMSMQGARLGEVWNIYYNNAPEMKEIREYYELLQEEKP